jgi:DNA-binding NarL/FixJ family response regulator
VKFIKPYHMKGNTIQLGIVDDHSLFRKALRNVLTTFDGFEVVIEAVNGSDLFQKLETRSEIDVLLLDLYMPGVDGREALKILHSKYPHIKIIILSMNIELKTVSELLNFGIYGYIPKEADISELQEAIRSAFKGTLYQNKILTEALYWRTNNSINNDTGRNGHSFNEKQQKILQLLWQEKTTQEIAEEVFLSVSAVDKIKQQLKEKTGAKTTLGLIKYGIQKSIIAL